MISLCPYLDSQTFPFIFSVSVQLRRGVTQWFWWVPAFLPGPTHHTHIRVCSREGFLPVEIADKLEGWLKKLNASRKWIVWFMRISLIFDIILCDEREDEFYLICFWSIGFIQPFMLGTVWVWRCWYRNIVYIIHMSSRIKLWCFCNAGWEIKSKITATWVLEQMVRQCL